MQIEIVEKGERLWTEATLVRLRFYVFSSNMTIEIILSSECTIADVTDVVLRDIRVVSVEMLAQFVFVEESFTALATREWLVVFVPQHMSDDLLAVWIRLLTHATSIGDVFFVILSVSDHVVEWKGNIGAQHTSMLGLGM